MNCRAIFKSPYGLIPEPGTMENSMKERNVFLEKIHLKNFLSLRDVILPLKHLTVLVGPNASGKSNVLRSLALLQKMMYAESPPPSDFIQDTIWAGGANQIGFHLQAKADGSSVDYRLDLDAKADDRHHVAFEELTIDKVKKVKVIAVRNGQGEVRDEDGENPTKYRPSKPKLSLKSASDYGDKPVTTAFTEFIRDWEFYNFQPAVMRGEKGISIIVGQSKESASLANLPDLDTVGSSLKDILAYWSENDERRFKSVNEAIEDCMKRRIEYRIKNGDTGLYLWEGYPVPLDRASDGTMFLLAYQVLLNHPEVSPLIAIEEPERNLHPGALKEIAGMLEQLSERCQVIITTHSSQLLDAFDPESLSDNLGVLLLRNISGQGTQVVNLKDAVRDRKALDGWITDFGIGSAIFESELLQYLTED